MKEDQIISTHEIIEAANEKPMIILIIGKPRSGKSWTGKDLSLALDLVHINIERYLNALEKKIAAYEPPTDLEEGQEPPKWLSDFEENIHNNLWNGEGPKNEEIIQIFKEQVLANDAQTKGFIIDFPYYRRNETWADTIRHNALGF